jgi:hypothetical protein
MRDLKLDSLKREMRLSFLFNLFPTSYLDIREWIKESMRVFFVFEPVK